MINVTRLKRVVYISSAGREREGREGEGREGKGRGGKGREGEGREGKGREGGGGTRRQLRDCQGLP